MKILNYVGNKLFCFLVSFILHQRISDTLCGTKAVELNRYAVGGGAFLVGLDPDI